MLEKSVHEGSNEASACTGSNGALQRASRARCMRAQPPDGMCTLRNRRDIVLVHHGGAGARVRGRSMRGSTTGPALALGEGKSSGSMSFSVSECSSGSFVDKVQPRAARLKALRRRQKWGSSATRGLHLTGRRGSPRVIWPRRTSWRSSLLE